MSVRKVLYRVAAALALPIVIVVVWYLGTSASTNPFVPKPVQIVIDLATVWIGPLILETLGTSLYRLGIGLGAAIAAGVLLGLLIGSSRGARKLTGPLFEFVRAVPPPVLLPVLLLVFGIGDYPKIFLIFLGCLWPILLNTVDGVRAVDTVLADTTRSYAISGWSRFRYFVLPAAMPRIMTGIRLALPISIILMVVSEPLRRVRRPRLPDHALQADLPDRPDVGRHPDHRHHRHRALGGLPPHRATRAGLVLRTTRGRIP